MACDFGSHGYSGHETTDVRSLEEGGWFFLSRGGEVDGGKLWVACRCGCASGDSPMGR